MTRTKNSKNRSKAYYPKQGDTVSFRHVPVDTGEPVISMGVITYVGLDDFDLKPVYYVRKHGTNVVVEVLRADVLGKLEIGGDVQN